MNHIGIRRICHRLVATVFFSLVPALAIASQSMAQDFVVRIDGREPVRNLEGRVFYHLDDTRLQDVADVASLANFERVRTHEPDFQYTTSAIWLKISAANQQAESVDMRMTFQTNFMTELAVYRVKRGGAETLLDQKPDSIFASRPIPHPNIIVPIAFEPQERADIYIRYISRGSTTLPIRFETLPSFEAWSQSYTAKLFAFYALMFAFAIMSAVAFVVMPRAIFLSYSFYAIAVILYIGQRDGVAFQYFWPSAPVLNGYASLPLGCLVGLAAAIFARVFLNTHKDYPGADLFLRFFIVGCVALPLSALFIGESDAKKLATYWVTLGAVSFLVIGARAMLLMKSIEARIILYLVGWLGIVFGTILVTARDVMGISPGRSETLDIVRMATLFDATLMGLAMTAAILHIRQERDKSLRDRVDALQSNLALHERLNAVENRYEQAAEEAEKRGRVLANASHDIRQPLFALRTTLRELESTAASGSHRSASGQSKSIERSLNYIEALVDDFMKQALNEQDVQAGLKGPKTPISVIFEAMHGMFSNEALTKGLELRIVSNSKLVSVDAFPLMRAVTNLVANAVAYTKSGKVLVGCRRRGDRLVIAVYDTGSGLLPADVARVLRRNERADDDDENPGGEGLGLSIVREVADEQGLVFSVRSEPEKGSCFSIEAPLAN